MGEWIMGIAELLILAVGLSMDAMAVSICKGLAMKKATVRAGMTCGLWFGGFQALMPLIGFFLGALFADAIEAFDHWVAFGLLAVIGVNMLKEALEKGESCPTNSADLSARTMFVMAVATSIDALAVGISFAFAGHTTLASLAFPLTAIGIASFVLSVVGCLIGVYFGKHTRFKMEYFGGAVLIGIGVKIVLEHLGLLT